MLLEFGPHFWYFQHINLLKEIMIVYSMKHCCQGFLPEASYGLRVLSSPASVCVCVCPSTFFVRMITHLTFQLQSSNLDQKIQQILLKVPIVFGVDWPWTSRSNLTSFQNFVYLHLFYVLKYLWDLHKNGSFLNCCPAQMIPHIYRFHFTRWHGRATDRETV